MRVLHVITGLTAGGAETQLRLLLRHTRHDGDVLCLYNAGSVASQLRKDGVTVIELGMRSNKEPRAVLRLARLVRQGRYDVVHTHLYRACIYGRAAARLAGVRAVVATEHSLVDDQLEGRTATAGVRSLYRATERLGRCTIAVSQAVRDNLLRWGVAADRIVVVPNGLDLPALAFDAGTRAQVRRSLGIPSDAVVVGAVGRLHPGKRFDELLTALAPALGPHRRLLLVGGGPEQARLTTLAHAAGVDRYVHLVGEQPVRGHLSAMDVFASLSRYETFGLAVLEALANGLPVVYRRCPALEELNASPPAVHRAPDEAARLVALLNEAAHPVGDRSCPAALQQLAIPAVAAAVDRVHERAAHHSDTRPVRIGPR